MAELRSLQDMRKYFSRLPFPLHFLIIGVLVISVILGFQAVFSANFTKKNYDWSLEDNIFTFVVQAINFIFWAILSPIVYNLSLRTKFQKGSVLKDILLSLFYGVFLATAHELTTSFLYYSIMGDLLDGGWSFLNFRYLSFAISTRFLEFVGIYILFIALGYYKKYRDSKNQLEAVKDQLNEAKLNALKMQLHPHFLFNTLNTISSLIDENTEKAQDMIAKFGDLFRTVLEQGDITSVTLEEELAFIKNYLSIEEIRFLDRLKVNYKFDKSLGQALVPNLILQPLVENAIKHGFSTHSGDCEITISGQTNGDTMELTVSDNGVGSEGFKNGERTGIGLGIVKKRLSQFYKNNFDLNYKSTPGMGFRVSMIVPIIKAVEK